jgi:hypothetical protein
MPSETPNNNYMRSISRENWDEGGGADLEDVLKGSFSALASWSGVRLY